MKKRSLILIAAAETILLFLGVYFEPTLGVRGHLRGEAFFDGKPTSWWRRELENWELDLKDAAPGGWHYYCERNPTGFEKVLESLKFASQKDKDPVILRPQDWAGRAPWGPRLLNGDAEAAAVLQELLDDPSPKIRQFARIGLKLD